MAQAPKQAGRCLCGKVRFSIAKPLNEVVACHCSMCRRWSGGVLLTVDCQEHEIAFEGEEHIRRYRSSEWADRGFCAHCGSGLFYHLLEAGQYFVSAGTLDGAGDLALQKEYFIDEKPPYYAFSNETRKLTEAEVFALYAPPGEK